MTLSKLTCDILAASGRLTGQVHAPEVLRRVANLVREMNCYYSNLIEELMRVVRTLIDEGEIPRTRVQEITGKGATVSAEIIKLGLQEGLVESPSPKGSLQPGFPSKILEFYFPQLFVDLPADAGDRVQRRDTP